MYASPTTKFIVGIFTLVGIGALAFLSFRLGDISLFHQPGIVLYANFDNISGLKINDRVEIAGVPVGRVGSITLKDDQAHVGLRIEPGVQVDNEAIAAIKTSGIIGDKYVSIALGSGDHALKSGATIRQTQSALVLEDLLGQLVNESGSPPKQGQKTGSKQ